MKINKPSKKNILRIILPLIAVLLLFAGYTAYAYSQKQWPFTSEPKNSTSPDSSTTSSQTEQEIEASQDGKKNNEEPATEPPTGTDKKTVQVAISYADINEGKLEIRAFTGSIIEGTGTCTATVTNGSQTITKSSSAFIDISSSICEPIYINESELSKGEWQVTVKYSSPTAQGTSETVEVTV